MTARRLLCALAGWTACLFAGPVAAQGLPLQPREVAAGVWMAQGASALGTPANRDFTSNAAFVVTREGVVVIDALGSPGLVTELLAAIARITPQPVRQVVVTHFHADHIHGLQVLKDAGAVVTAQRDGQVYLQSDAATWLVPADRWISEPARLALGAVDFLLLPAGPAHTAEDLVVYLPQQRVLLAGDLVFRGRIPFDEAYARADWSRFTHLPLFAAANRINAYNTYLLMEQSTP